MKKTSTSRVVTHIQKIAAELSQSHDKEHQIAANILMDYIRVQNTLLNAVVEAYKFTSGFCRTDEEEGRIKKKFWKNVRKMMNKNNGKIKPFKSPPLYNGELYYNTKTFIIKRNGVIIHRFDRINDLCQADTLIQQNGFVRKYGWGAIHAPASTISTCLLLLRSDQERNN